MRSLESTVEPNFCDTVNPLLSPTLAVIAVALEMGLPGDVAVGSSQRAVEDADSDVP